MSDRATDAERRRLDEDRLGTADWRRWGPYLAERQWSTVREDYSPDGKAWDYFPHDHARSRAYRWGEDGIAGVSDSSQRLCLSLALWNGEDPFLKERLFGLTNEEGNHGEDVKEVYYYLDATPTHSYLKFLYKYPQAEFPYARLVAENASRTKSDPEFELIDTGIFDERRYFDVEVEYAKATPLDLAMRVTIHNRGPDQAEIHVLPQLWFRNDWSWKPDAPKPTIVRVDDRTIRAQRAKIGSYTFRAVEPAESLFCENETNAPRIFGVDRPGPFKDGFHDAIVSGRPSALNPDGLGTKAAFHRRLTIPAGGSVSLDFALEKTPGAVDVEATLRLRRDEADAFYAEFQRNLADPDARLVQRQALAGLIWSKQYYYYDIPEWLDGDPGQPPPPESRKHGRNADWRHLNNGDVIAMPDTWEYPWYAAWDLAFHAVAFAMIDPEFAKAQLLLLTREWYTHPNGQLPAYEWAFGDVNPPVHAGATWRVFVIDRKRRGDAGDLAFLERVFHKLMLNFNWWVNRKDEQGRNIFQGGFLGLDNIGVFDRSSPLPMGGRLNQADGTAWMAMYALNLLKIALELALHNPVYQGIATKFFEHFLGIAGAMTSIGGDGQGVGLWDEEDEFYYDELVLPDGTMTKLKVRSLVGLIPLFAVETLEPETMAALPEFCERLRWYLEHRPQMAELVSRWEEPGRGERRLLSLLRGHRMKRLLARMLDETEFLADYGVRSLSKVYGRDPYHYRADGESSTVRYEPGESDSGLFGGNSNWRGPIWFPVNFLIIQSLRKFHHYYGDDFRVECPTGSGRYHSIDEVACELALRLSRIFLRGPDGRRPVFGDSPLLQDDPHFRDYIPFFEYFHGEDGHGLGASHQTGWTALIADLLQPDPIEVGATLPSTPEA